MVVKAANFVQEAAWLVDIGNKRENNEDSAAALSFNLANNNPVGIYVVADGMGGHVGGELASEMAIQVAIRNLVETLSATINPTPEQYEYWLVKAIHAANTAVYTHNLHHRMNMGTTLILAMVIDNWAYIANVGDSRAYIVTPTDIQQISEDHNMAQELVRYGAISKKEAVSHPFRNVLSRAIGTKPEVDADLFHLPLSPDSTLLLCSDGLTKDVDDRTIYQIVRGAPSTQDACNALIATAKAHDAHDNISVVLTHLKMI